MPQQLISWLITRMEWVYGFVVNDLGLSSKIGYAVIILLIGVFFYDLYDIYKHRNTGTEALVWLLIVLIAPLGTLIYLALGWAHIRQAPVIAPQPVATPLDNQSPAPNVVMGASGKATKRTATTLGTIVGGIALAAGAIMVVFFVFIGIAMIQCANDPKCM